MKVSRPEIKASSSKMTTLKDIIPHPPRSACTMPVFCSNVDRGGLEHKKVHYPEESEQIQKECEETTLV